MDGFYVVLNLIHGPEYKLETTIEQFWVGQGLSPSWELGTRQGAGGM
jgi:hypothetical protein